MACLQTSLICHIDYCQMSTQYPKVEEQLPQPSAIQRAIADAKAAHPDGVVVYFIKHKAAPESLPRPKTPLMMFKRDTRVQEVFYALYQQIEIKGLGFFVLKSEKNNLLSYFNVKPGQSIGQLYDSYSYNNYLALIYNNGPLKRWNFTPTQLRVIRISFILAMAWIVMNLYPIVQNYLSPNSNTQGGLPAFEEES